MTQNLKKAPKGVEGLTFHYEPHHIFLQNQKGDTVGEITFPALDANTVEMDHTFVEPELRGNGLGAELVEAAVEYIKKEGKKAVPTCSFVKAQFEEHPEYLDLASKIHK